MRHGICALIFVATLAIATAYAGEPAPVPPDLKATLQARFPDRQFLVVRPSPVAGIFEVFTRDSLVYSDASGEHLFVGTLVDTRSRRDLTAAALDARNAIDFDALPLEQAIKVVKGTGSRRVAVFADPDCPFCRQLEAELARIDDVTVYTFLYPIEDLHPGATDRARAIWCAPDRGAAWLQWMKRQQQPGEPATGACGDDPVQANLEFGLSARVLSTPTLFFPSGYRLSAVPRAPELERLLDAPVQSGETAQQKRHVSGE